MSVITSTTNPLVKDLVRLRSRRHRDREKRFLIEGRREIALAMRGGVELHRLVVCPDLGGEAITGHPLVEMAEAPFRKVSVRQNPDGFLAVADHLDARLDRLRLPEGALVLWVESIEKPGNLGAMLRTADAVGVDGVIVTDPTTDIHNPNVVRASQGALFTVAVAVASAAEAADRLAREGIRLVALTPAASNSLWDTDLAGPVAVAIGAEATGLSPEVVAVAAEEVMIPMSGAVDSLNASVAAAVVLYEAARQRRQS